jgi:hypothetical protein
MVAAIVAHVLRVNGATAGDQELDASTAMPIAAVTAVGTAAAPPSGAAPP